MGYQLGFGLVGEECEEVGIVGLANVAIGGLEVTEPILGVGGDEVLDPDHPYHLVVLGGALCDGRPPLTVLLQCLSAVLGVI